MSANAAEAPRAWWAAAEENVYAHQKRLRFILGAIAELRDRRGSMPSEISILDVGCGTGVMITLPLASNGYRVTGIDIDSGSVRAASKINPYPQLTFASETVEEVSARGKRYDVVIASEVLEHLADTSGFLRTLRGLVCPEGLLILTTPNGYGWFEWEAFLWKRVGLEKYIRDWRARWTRFLQALKAPVKWAIRWTPRPPAPRQPWERLENTSNVESPHLQRFRWSRLRQLIAEAGLDVVLTGQGSLFCGEITHHYLHKRRFFIRANAAVTEYLPRRLAAGWYLACRPSATAPRVLCLSDSGLMARASADVEKQFRVPPALLLSFRQLRQEPTLAWRLPWRRFDVAMVFLSASDTPLYRDFILSYLFLCRAARKIVRDIESRQVAVGVGEGLRAVTRCVADLAGFPIVYATGSWRAHRLSGHRSRRAVQGPASGRVAYLRANLWQESAAGGSVAHTIGVLGGLRSAGMQVTYVGTTEFPPARSLAEEIAVIPPRLRWMRNLPDLPFVAYSESFARQCGRLFRTCPPDFVYQRYSVFNFAGAWLARRCGCPFVLEYNGSEVWVARHWGARLFFETLAVRIEKAVLANADLIVVVSRVLRDELVSEGVPPTRILVNPNGVDPDRYSPACDGVPVRRRSGLEGKLVIGFIGTFGPWHGAEVLAQVIRTVVQQLPQAHFLFVGDGSRMAAVRAIVTRDGVESDVTFTGLVPQEEAPAYLAACDILASPHVPNPDGSRFFGSPTKLFEYMAMGKGIVASDLEQIGEILSHGKTAWLVKPGDLDELAHGIVVLGRDPALRQRLGNAARLEAKKNHTWTAHVGRILNAMRTLELLDPVGPTPPRVA